MAMVRERAEVVIIGAGVMGASLAFHLTRLGVRDILILEKKHVAAGASGKTGALLRQHYSNVPEATLVHRSVQVFKHWREIVGGACGYDGSGLIATVYQTGPDDPNVARMYANVAMQRRIGIETEVITAEQLRELQPFDRVDDLVYAAYEAEGGAVDAIATTRSLIAAAEQHGARLREGVTVTAIRTASGRAAGVETSDGPVDASVVVCCANAWSAPLLATAGVTVPIEVMRVPVAILERPPAMAAGHMAYVDTAAGIFCRQWKPGQTLMGVATAEHHSYVNPDTYDETVDATYGAAAIAQIATRMPPMRDARYLTGWAGLYDMSPDTHPILDRAPDVAGLFLMVGFSGAGFKKAPAIGECMAQVIIGEQPAVDLTPFRLARFDDDSWRQPWSENEYVFTTDFGHIF
jgi:sarcosine oxidase subunit beta